MVKAKKIITLPVLSSLVFLMAGIWLLYFPAFRWMFNHWLTDKLYSHGFIVPFISFYLVWLKRDQFLFLKHHPQYFWGSLMILICAVILWIGRASAIIQLESISLLLMLPALILFILGWRWLACLWMPLGYLLFMVPLIDSFLGKIQYPFQLISAKIAASTLTILGFSIFHDEIYIQFPNITIEVAKECSGIHFLFSVFAIAIPLVYITQKTWLKASCVLFSGFVLVILINSARVAISGYLGDKYGAEMIHGSSHIFSGFLVAQVGWVAIFFVNWAVSKLPSRSPYRLFEKWKDKDPVAANTSQENRSFLWPIGISGLILLGLFCWVNVFAVLRPIPIKKDLAAFPDRIDGMIGNTRDWLHDDVLFWGTMDNVLERSYRNEYHPNINLFIGYMSYQQENKRLLSYLDEQLFNNAVIKTIDIGYPSPLKLNHALLKINNVLYEVIFWYRFPDENRAKRSYVKFKTITDAIFHKRNSCAIIIVAKPAMGSSNAGTISDDLVSFVKTISPILIEHLP
jgi:exosortase